MTHPFETGLVCNECNHMMSDHIEGEVCWTCGKRCKGEYSLPLKEFIL